MSRQRVVVPVLFGVAAYAAACAPPPKPAPKKEVGVEAAVVSQANVILRMNVEAFRKASIVQQGRSLVEQTLDLEPRVVAAVAVTRLALADFPFALGDISDLLLSVRVPHSLKMEEARGPDALGRMRWLLGVELAQPVEAAEVEASVKALASRVAESVEVKGRSQSRGRLFSVHWPENGSLRGVDLAIGVRKGNKHLFFGSTQTVKGALERAARGVVEPQRTDVKLARAAVGSDPHGYLVVVPIESVRAQMQPPTALRTPVESAPASTGEKKEDASQQVVAPGAVGTEILKAVTRIAHGAKAVAIGVRADDAFQLKVAMLAETPADATALRKVFDERVVPWATEKLASAVEEPLPLLKTAASGGEGDASVATVVLAGADLDWARRLAEKVRTDRAAAAQAAAAQAAAPPEKKKRARKTKGKRRKLRRSKWRRRSSRQ